MFSVCWKMCVIFVFRSLKKKKKEQTFRLVRSLSDDSSVFLAPALPVCAPTSNTHVFKNSFCSNKTRVYDSLSDFVLSTDLFVQENRFPRLAHTAGSLCPCFQSSVAGMTWLLAHETCTRDTWRKTRYSWEVLSPSEAPSVAQGKDWLVKWPTTRNRNA